jgi:hypothetical protein
MKERYLLRAIANAPTDLLRDPMFLTSLTVFQAALAALYRKGCGPLSWQRRLVPSRS